MLEAGLWAADDSIATTVEIDPLTLSRPNQRFGLRLKSFIVPAFQGKIVIENPAMVISQLKEVARDDG